MLKIILTWEKRLDYKNISPSFVPGNTLIRFSRLPLKPDAGARHVNVPLIIGTVLRS